MQAAQELCDYPYEVMGMAGGMITAAGQNDHDDASMLDGYLPASGRLAQAGDRGDRAESILSRGGWQNIMLSCRGAPPGEDIALTIIKTGHVSLARGDTAEEITIVLM
jgi:hypothetical protein